MKAIIYTQYGSPDVLQLKDVPKPTPKDNEVLVKIHAVGLNAADWHFMRADPFLARFSAGLLKPKNPILGEDIAGTVEAVGSAVTRFKPGDAVFACYARGLAEYVCAPESRLTPKPANLSFEEAAAVPMAALTALQGLRDHGKIAAGQRVLIHGASGGVGTFAVQIARVMGAQVTAIASAPRQDMLRALGAETVIDYARQDFTEQPNQYDVILGVNGYHPLAHYARALRPGGRYVMVGGTNAQIFEAMLRAPFIPKPEGRQLTSLVAKAAPDDLRVLNEWIENGSVRPVIEDVYPLHDLPVAMRVVSGGHAGGKLVIDMMA